MLRLFGFFQGLVTPQVTNVTNEEWINLAKRNFQPIFGTYEVENLFTASHFLIQNLKSDADDFNIQYDSILMGTLIAACALEKMKYGFSPILYPKTLKELLITCHMNTISLFGRVEDDPMLHQFITTVGSKALNGELPIDSKFIKAFKQCAVGKNIPLEQRFNKYLPVENLQPSDSGDDIQVSSCTIL